MGNGIEPVSKSDSEILTVKQQCYAGVFNRNFNISFSIDCVEKVCF
jgi:hypothetical protein